MFKNIKEDIEAVFERDPAARHTLEVILTYSGLHAIWFYRISHFFWMREWFTFSRIISQLGRFFTGIEIHPGAKIGRKLFIDHGMGVVIGETCEIGNNVTIYQGVTLGGTGKEKGKRHPTIGNNVLIASGAKVLGSMTIGEGSKIGAGSVVLREVPPYSTVVGIPGRIVAQCGVKITDNLNHMEHPDPVMDTLRTLQEEIASLQKKIEILETNQGGQRENVDSYL